MSVSTFTADYSDSCQEQRDRRRVDQNDKVSTTVDELLVSQFIVDTCRHDCRPNSNRSKAFLQESDRGTVSGSVSELYIEPFLSCVGDVDIMYFLQRQLAVFSELDVPRQLSTSDFDPDRIGRFDCYFISIVSSSKAK